jgi:TolB-like protein/DNA-binding winged helix-turn-helix (wHTH) protein/Tfp pilus assembly protein PilF
METLRAQSQVLGFGVFELDLQTGELRRSGVRQPLAGQPVEVLRVLLEHPQQIVTREELRERLWPRDTFVDYDLALKKLISRLREALDDSAEAPRFIETIPKKGYRFLAPVTVSEVASKAIELAVPEEGSDTRQHPSSLPGRVAIALAAALLLIVVGFAAARFWRRPAMTSAAPQIHSIAVLPLQNLSGDPNQEYFSDGITDAFITDLAQIDSVRVISRTSSMQYKQTKKSLPEIARELNVDGIIEGTVQRSGDRVRITAQLILGASDKHLWANTYERDTRDVFELERDVTADVARQVRARLTSPSHVPAAQPRSVNPDALEAYLQGNYYLSKWGSGFADETLKKAREHFQHAIDTDPSFAPAYVGMAFTHENLMRGSSEDLAIALRSAKKAVELDLRYADAHETLGWIKLHHFWDWAGAEEEFRTAITLNPNSAGAHYSLCDLLRSLGRMNDALKECQIAQELDPNQDQLSEILYYRREYDQAIEQQLRWIDRYPDDGLKHYELYRLYVLKAMYKEAVQELARSLTLFGFEDLAVRIHHSFARAGFDAAMQEWANEIEHLSEAKQAFVPMSAADVYAILGDKDRAFNWLEQAYQHPELASIDDGLIDLKTDPLLDSLRSDPRYQDLLRRVGLPQ